MKRVLLLVLMAIGVSVRAANVSLSAEPYLEGGLFTDPAFPAEGDPLTITVRAVCDGDTASAIPARITITNANGAAVFFESLELARTDTHAEAAVAWTSENNGLFTVRAELDPENRMSESNESDNAAEIILPVTVKGRHVQLHFPWYREVPFARWTTVVTSSGEEGFARLRERGVIPLNWEYGGMSWTSYDEEKATADPEAVLAEIEQVFYEKFTRGGDEFFGFGIDEVGGYPGSFKLNASIASMKALARAKRERPERFFAVWNGGGPRPEVANLAREGADLFLLETYLWRALPDELGVQDIYAAIDARVSPYILNTDMFQPAYGNPCYTLLALDTSERPDRTSPGELEEVIRHIRRRFPEMRGIAWYNGGFDSRGYGLKRSAEMERHHETILRTADRLCFDYWVKPCLTFLPHSLWLERDESGKYSVSAALSNLGAVDSGPVELEFRCDDQAVATQTAAGIPAGANRNENRLMFSEPVDLAAGPHRFAVRIISAPGATVLEGSAALERFVE